MAVQLADMKRRLAHMLSTSTEWEVEVGVGTRALREEDQAWARQMYEEGHRGGGASGHSTMHTRPNTYCYGMGRALARRRAPISA